MCHLGRGSGNQNCRPRAGGEGNLRPPHHQITKQGNNETTTKITTTTATGTHELDLDAQQ